MTPPLISVLEEGQSNSSFAVSSTSLEEICLKSSELKERNYMGLSDCSSVDSSALPGGNSEGTKCSLNLRLGLPGSQSPERNPEACLLSPRKLDEKPLFPFLPTKQDTPSKDDSVSTLPKNIVLRNKRGFSDVMAEFSEVKDVPYAEGNWMFPANGNESETSQSMAQGNFIKSEVNLMLSRPSLNSGLKSVSVKDDSGADPGMLKGVLPAKGVQDKFHGTNGKSKNQTGPTAKAQVIGWPPIRSFRKNTLVANTKNNEEVEKPGPGALYVKVSMDGAPYLRKVDLRSCFCYRDLSSALEKMFSCFTIGQCGPHGAPGREILSESKMRDLLHGSEYVLTYEDKDQDWMLVGDVPWEMFIDSCKRMRIMKSCDAIGLAPRAMEKCKNKN